MWGYLRVLGGAGDGLCLGALDFVAILCPEAALNWGGRVGDIAGEDCIGLVNHRFRICQDVGGCTGTRAGKQTENINHNIILRRSAFPTAGRQTLTARQF